MTARSLAAQQRSARAAAWLSSPVQLDYSSSAIEALKWIALVSMLIDHGHAILFHAQYPVVEAMGRLAFPLFAFTLGFNLARHEQPKLRPAARKMLIAGVVAQPFFWLMAGNPWRLNIFSTFLATLGLIALSRKPRSTARDLAIVALFLGAGALVDYFWYGIAITWASYYCCSTRTRAGVLAFIASVLALTLFLALAIGWPAFVGLLSLPLLWHAQCWQPSIRRFPWLFYAFYPLHLALLTCAAMLLSHP